MRQILSLIIITLAILSCNKAQEVPEPSLKAALADKFLVGVAMNSNQITGRDSAGQALITRHFSSIVAENGMKCEVIHPEEHTYNFSLADSLVSFGQDNDMAIIGHCLVWHSQCAPWMFVDSCGNTVSADILRERLHDHITTIVSRYKGRVHGWDVVNEALLDDGSYRQSMFYQILGPDYIPLAFAYAHEADPDAELYYNDYAMNLPAKRDAVVQLIQSLQTQGLRLDAVGMQGHMGMDYPDIDEFEASITAFAATGVHVMITEWDMSALPTVSQSANISDKVTFDKLMNPYPTALPDSVSTIWNDRMARFLQLFLAHADIITRVTAWGLTDGDSWKNDFPMKGRREYPLLFDRDYQMKPFLRELLDSSE